MSLPRIEVLKFLDKIYDKPHSGVGFTLLSRSYYYLRRRSPAAPRSRPTTVRQGNGGLLKYKASLIRSYYKIRNRFYLYHDAFHGRARFLTPRLWACARSVVRARE